MQHAHFLRPPRRPVHTPDRLLNVFFACRTPRVLPLRASAIRLWRAARRVARAATRHRLAHRRMGLDKKPLDRPSADRGVWFRVDAMIVAAWLGAVP